MRKYFVYEQGTFVIKQNHFVEERETIVRPQFGPVTERGMFAMLQELLVERRETLYIK